MHKILVIIQRSNGDVFLASPLLNELKRHYPESEIDLLINHDTLGIAKTLANVNRIIVYDYRWKKKGLLPRIRNELKLLKMLWGKYDLSLSLTASDRSVLYAGLAAANSLSCIEKDYRKSWWKRLLLRNSFDFNPQRHIVEHTYLPLKLLGLEYGRMEVKANVPPEGKKELETLPFDVSSPFLIFHPTAQYSYKIYPQSLRNHLLELLNTLKIPIAVTGGPGDLDRKISMELPDLPNIYNLIGKTSLAGYIALCQKSTAYIGMDTLNMHIAAALDKPVFAIFGPTFPQIWSPWCNQLQRGTPLNAPVQCYGNMTLFQANMSCVACGKAGCDDRHGVSECLHAIDPTIIFNEVKKCLNR